MCCGSRIRVQRMGTGGRPVWYHTAVADTTSIVRWGARYHPVPTTVVQEEAASHKTYCKVGKRLPFKRGRPV